MNDHSNKVLLSLILICLLVLVFQSNKQPISSPEVNEVNIESSETVIKLEGDKIAVINTNRNSGLWGTVLIFELDKSTNSFKLTSHFSYQDYFRNPQNYGLDS